MGATPLFCYSGHVARWPVGTKNALASHTDLEKLPGYISTYWHLLASVFIVWTHGYDPLQY